MKLRFFLALCSSVVLMQTARPAMSVQCTDKPADLSVKAHPEQRVESKVLDCMLANEAAIHLTGELASSLTQAQGHVVVRFFDRQGKRLLTSRRGPWIGAFSGFTFSDSFAVPPNAVRLHVVGHVESSSKEAAGEWRITGLTVSPSVVVIGEAPEGTVITSAQTAYWRFTTVPAEARGEFQMELRTSTGQTLETRTIWKTGAQTIIDFGKLPVGYYQAYMRFNPRQNHAGIWTSALVVLPDDSPPNETRFGMDAVLSWMGGPPGMIVRSLGMMRQAGIGAVRDRVRWSQVQPTRQSADWKHYEDVARATIRAGMEPVQAFHDSPSWARPVGSLKSNRQFPTDDTAVFEFGQAYAKGLGKTVRSVEYWNEPNLKEYFAGYPFQYASGLKAFSAGVKSVDPNIRVLIGSAVFSPEQFFRGVYRNGAANFFDTRNQHFYGNVDELDRYIDKHLAALERDGGVADRPGWMTEIGYPLHRDKRGNWQTAEQNQAEFLVKAYVGGFAAGYERVFYFFWSEFVQSDIHTWGIIRRDDFSPRPAYLALALLTRHLAGASILAAERHDTGRTVYFKKTDGSIVAVTWGGGAKISRLGASVIIYDIFGQKLYSTSVKANSSTPLLLSQIDKVPAQARPVNMPKQVIHATHPIRLEPRLRINEKDHIFPAENRIMVSVNEGGTLEIVGRIYSSETERGETTVDCIPGPGLVLLSPARLAFEQPKPEGETFICRFRTNLDAIGDSHAAVQGKKGKYSDAVQIALTPDTASAGSLLATQPLMSENVCPRWKLNHSANLSTTIEIVRNIAAPCHVNIKSQVKEQGNSWVFPKAKITGSSLTASVGLRVLIDQVPDWGFPPVPLQLQLIEKNGRVWLINLQQSDREKVYIGLFSRARVAPWGRTGDNSPLNLGNVRETLIGWGGHSGTPGQRYGFTIETINMLKER
jgi:hypothetical protein